jgi:hypothetical protein
MAAFLALKMLFREVKGDWEGEPWFRFPRINEQIPDCFKERLGNSFNYPVEEGGKTMRKHILILVLAAFTLVAVVGPVVARGPKDHSWKDFPSPAARQGETRTIAGLVERTDAGIAIVSSGGHKYMVTGEDLSNFVGKKVAATGELSTAGGRDTIAVTSYREYCC